MASTQGMCIYICNQGILIVTLYSYLSILVGKISTAFLCFLEDLVLVQAFESMAQYY
jgi:hypothetical protein